MLYPSKAVTLRYSSGEAHTCACKQDSLPESLSHLNNSYWLILNFFSETDDPVLPECRSLRDYGIFSGYRWELGGVKNSLPSSLLALTGAFVTSQSALPWTSRGDWRPINITYTLVEGFNKRLSGEKRALLHVSVGPGMETVPKCWICASSYLKPERGAYSQSLRAHASQLCAFAVHSVWLFSPLQLEPSGFCATFRTL